LTTPAPPLCQGRGTFGGVAVVICLIKILEIRRKLGISVWRH